jgi:DNA anti-recombination protein RmuC
MSEQSPNSKAAWEEVGRQFEALGKSISDAFGAAWQDPNNRTELEKIKASIKQMADDVEKTVSQAASSEHGQRIKADAEKAAQSLAESARETYDEVKPQVANALKKAGEELNKLVNKIEGND